AKGIDLDHQGQGDAPPFPQLDQSVENRLPLPVPREIVIRDEKLVDALPPVEAHEMLDVVGRAITRLAALYVDVRAKRALVRAAATGVEAAIVADGAGDVAFGEARAGGAGDAGKVRGGGRGSRE